MSKLSQSDESISLDGQAEIVSVEGDERAAGLLVADSGRTDTEIVPRPHDESMLDHLVELWTKHRQSGLDLRHMTGSFLNDSMGPPTKRQAHGYQVLKRVAAKLKIAESDLSRMRWFAHLFESRTEAKWEELGIKSWTMLKRRLPALITEAKGRKPNASTDQLSGGIVLRGVHKSFNSVVRKLTSGIELGEGERQQLEETLQALAEAACRLGIQIRMHEPQAVSGPSSVTESIPRVVPGTAKRSA